MCTISIVFDGATDTFSEDNSVSLFIFMSIVVLLLCLSEGEKRGEAKEEEEKEENELTYVQKSCIAARYT